MRRGAAWAAGAVLVLGAGLLTAVTPSVDSLYGPFLRHGGATDTVTSRTLTASVLAASFADEIVSADGEWSAAGNWLVVEVAASAPTTEEDAEIPFAALHVGGLVVHASERPEDSLLRTPLRVGTDTVGILAFELPEGARGGRAELRLTTEYLTPELDDVIALEIPLDAVGAVPRVELTEPRVVGAP